MELEINNVMYRKNLFETFRSNEVEAVRSLTGVIIRLPIFDELKRFLQGINSEISERTIDEVFEYVVCFVKAVLYSLAMKDEEREWLIRETGNKYQSEKMFLKSWLKVKA